MRIHLLSFLLFCCVLSAHAQTSNLRIKTIAATSDTIKLDSLSIFPNSFVVFCGNHVIPKENYVLESAGALFALYVPCYDSLTIQYRVLPIDLSHKIVARDAGVIYKKGDDHLSKYLISNSYDVSDAFGGTAIDKKGSISRGVSFGNNQNLAINSTLNLELSGEIAPNLKLLASISDNNLPIQPDGNTNKLQQFDQVFIQLYNDRMKLIAGDFWLSKPTGYFLNYKKRTQGLTIDYRWGSDSTSGWRTQLSGALSKGKFARQNIQGVEGNQGPYRLKGSENEPFIIILSGTERVYIDGKLLKRGQAFDYTIDYNASEVVFTARNLITKDSRIVVEFQYSDQSYARSLYQTSTTFTSKKISYWLNMYTEQDVKNQPMQQQLTNSQKYLLSTIGDSLNLARTNSIDSVGYQENQVMYKLIDSLGYDSILVYSVNVDSALYKATFSYVGEGKGDYAFNNLNALGKIYKWVAPVGGVHQGAYEPSQVIMTPKQKKMITSGITVAIRKNVTLESELAYSTNDLNTFSKLNNSDDKGYAAKNKIIGTLPLGRNANSNWVLETKLELEALNRNFSPIEQYRAVEFDRDWNTRNKGFKGNQLATTVGANFKNALYGNFNIEGQQFLIGNDYSGKRFASNGKWLKNGLTARWNGSYLASEAIQKNSFFRHRFELSKGIKRIKIGYLDDHELNRFGNSSTKLQGNSYQFFDYQFYIANSDSTQNAFRVYYRERYDQLSDSIRLVPTAKARTIGGEIKLTQLKNQSLNIIANYRELRILNQNLLNQTPENALLGRIDYELRMLKGAFTSNSFYEIGSGLELKREFIYIKVNDGQGIYTWIDYNANGVKDLNEFEIAQYADQANYIRVFTPSNTYIKTYSNEFNQSFFWRPERIWETKSALKQLLARFSDQLLVRINRKTNVFNGVNAFNPFSTHIRDTTLMGSTTHFKNTVYLNRTATVFGMEYTFQTISNKTLLATGFDSKSNQYHEIAMRWNIQKVFGIEATMQQGIKDAQADYTSGRNYSLQYRLIQPSLIYQPSTHFRLSINSRFAKKQNALKLGGEQARILELGTSFKFNKAENSSFHVELKCLNILFNGIQNSALGFEMLEALKPGINYTWNVSYQRSVSKNLQVSFQYAGRKSEVFKMIHSGGMEVRAFF